MQHKMCIPAHAIQTLARCMKQSKQRTELAYRTRQLTFATVTSGPNRAPDCPHHANICCWLLLLLSLQLMSLLLRLLLLSLTLLV